MRQGIVAALIHFVLISVLMVYLYAKSLVGKSPDNEVVIWIAGLVLMIVDFPVYIALERFMSHTTPIWRDAVIWTGGGSLWWFLLGSSIALLRLGQPEKGAGSITDSERG
jgi:hypothetical protein